MTFKFPKLFVWPTWPLNVTTALPAFNVSAGLDITPSPSSVLLKLILAPAGVPPPFVESKVSELFFKTTGPVIVMTPPLVVILSSTLMTVEPV